LNSEEYVYCTACKNFKIVDTNGNFVLNCKFENECEFWNPEDSMKFKDRPKYQPISIR